MDKEIEDVREKLGNTEARNRSDNIWNSFKRKNNQLKKGDICKRMETNFLKLSVRDLGLAQHRVADGEGNRTRTPTPVRDTQQAETDIRP